MQNLNVNITPDNYPQSLYYSQNDVGREFKINITDFTIPVGATVKIQATKPSGFGFSVAGTVSGNSVTFETTDEMTDEAGRFPAELVIESGAVVIGTANFLMVGEMNPHPEGTTDGSQGTIIPELTLLVERVEAAASSVLDMQVVAQTLPAGSQASYSYDEDLNKATFGIPEGQAGAGAAGVVASAYSAAKTYKIGDYVLYNSNLYRCTTAITTAEAWTAAHWTQIVLADDVTDLKTDITYFPIDAYTYAWDIGKSVASDGDFTNNTASAITGYIPVSGVDAVEFPTVVDANNKTINFYLVEYATPATSGFIRRTTASGLKVKIGNTTEYVRFIFARASSLGIAMTQSDIDTYFSGKIYQISELLWDKLTAKHIVPLEQDYEVTSTWTLGQIVGSNGQIGSSETYAVSDYIERESLMGLRALEIVDSNDNPFNTFIATYDAQKRFTGRFSGKVYFSAETEYFRIVFGRASSTAIVITDETINTYFAIKELTYVSVAKDSNLTADKPQNIGVLNCINRAKQLCMLTYTTKEILPNQVADYPANTTITGAPYSSARLYDKFIGLNVSIHTFMTAINNPRSVIYTEVLTTDNAKTYYGTVCSSFTAYALGSPVREITKKILMNTTDYTTKSINELALGDICVNDGHIVLVTNINRDEYGRIATVTTMESMPPHCIVKSYTWDGFVTEVNTKSYRIASYNNIGKTTYTPSKYVPLMDEPEQNIVYSPICTNYGDAPLMKVGETLTVNVLNSTNATAIHIFKNGVRTDIIESTLDQVINCDSVGAYEARLYNGNAHAYLGTTTWDVCDGTVSKNGNRVSFTCSENCTPLYVSFNDSTGSAFNCIALTEEDITNGYVDTDYSGSGINVLKVYVGNTDSSTAFSTTI